MLLQHLPIVVLEAQVGVELGSTELLAAHLALYLHRWALSLDVAEQLRIREVLALGQ